jgi:enterochelin esterase-like enzyme
MLKMIYCLCLLFSMPLWARFELFLKDYHSAHLKSARDIYVYRPQNYSPKNTYRLIVMHDGQNLFDPSRAFMGRTWNAQKTLDELIARNEIPPVVVLAIDNTPERRAEYVWEEEGESYVDMIIQELLPLVERSYSLKKGAKYRAMIGSSLGGLISLRVGLHRSEHFGLIAALSPSLWWNNREILSLYERENDLPARLYIDMGEREGERPQDLRLMVRILEERGHPHFYYWLDHWGGHNEWAWAYRLPMALRFLFTP